MASFRIHEDQENAALGLRKDNADVFSASQRRALGDLSQFACNQNRNLKLPGLANVPCKAQDENRTVRQINNEKNIVPPVAQFRAFSVYEDNKPGAAAEPDSKKQTTFKFVVKENNKKENLFQNAAENSRAVCAQQEKADRPKETSVVRLPLQEKKNAAIESPMSVVHDSSILSQMSISKNESHIVDDDDEEDTTTAQTDREMFFHVVEYRQDIYEYMREIEIKHRANPRYMRKQPDITHSMRAILVDWLAEVCEEYSQQSETLHLAVSYVDRFLSYMSVLRAKLQLVGTAATFIAAKYEEVYPPEVGEFVYITDDTYTKREVLRMEHLILKVLSFDLSTPTALAFLSHYCISNGLSKKTFHLAAYIAELSLLEADPYLQYKPSIIAASSLATARHCLLCRHCDPEATSDLPETRLPLPECIAVAWPPALERCSGYEAADLQACMKELARTHSHAPLQAHQAIPEKFKNNKFEGVSTVEPRPMFAVPKYTPPAPAAKPDARPAEPARPT
ncbi:cyclin-A2 [Plutella xylostella]|uniref:cyclin-A2 n=1 Tax=Plutella xylostella TaxID=51655 RepID=UPI002032B526|nr:cyclin-A2 [Plutella xylostella]